MISRVEISHLSKERPQDFLSSEEEAVKGGGLNVMNSHLCPVVEVI